LYFLALAICSFWRTTIVLFGALTIVRRSCYNLPAMSQKGDQSSQDRGQRALNLTLAAVAGQVGCLTLIIVLGALVGGLWLDARLDSRPLFTIILMIGSVPVTLVAMFWVVRKATAGMRTGTNRNSQKEAAERETDS
jgi:F0F1-type ATP synthase assembly protein I